VNSNPLDLVRLRVRLHDPIHLQMSLDLPVFYSPFHRLCEQLQEACHLWLHARRFAREARSTVRDVNEAPVSFVVSSAPVHDFIKDVVPMSPPKPARIGVRECILAELRHRSDKLLGVVGLFLLFGDQIIVVNRRRVDERVHAYVRRLRHCLIFRSCY
jgi:hypothetical protein